MEYWMIGVLKTIGAETLHERSIGNRVAANFPAFKTLPSLPSHYSSTPTLHYSINAVILGQAFGPFQGIPNKATSSGWGFFTERYAPFR
jgi:hypothetical protein